MDDIDPKGDYLKRDLLGSSPYRVVMVKNVIEIVPW